MKVNLLDNMSKKRTILDKINFFLQSTQNGEKIEDLKKNKKKRFFDWSE